MTWLAHPCGKDTATRSSCLIRINWPSRAGTYHGFCIDRHLVSLEGKRRIYGSPCCGSVLRVSPDIPLHTLLPLSLAPLRSSWKVPWPILLLTLSCLPPFPSLLPSHALTELYKKVRSRKDSKILSDVYGTIPIVISWAPSCVACRVPMSAMPVSFCQSTNSCIQSQVSKPCEGPRGYRSYIGRLEYGTAGNMYSTSR